MRLQAHLYGNLCIAIKTHREPKSFLSYAAAGIESTIILNIILETIFKLIPLCS